MRIDITGLNVEVTDGTRAKIEKRFEKIGRLVSELATCEVILSEERNPAIADSQKAEANLHVKGVTLHAQARSADIKVAIREVADDLTRQVERRKEKIRGYRKVGTETVRHLQGVEEAESP
jgi:putative sigma-54 modulation protein